VDRGGLGARIDLLNVMGERDREQFLKRLPDRPVSAVMTADPVTNHHSDSCGSHALAERAAPEASSGCRAGRSARRHHFASRRASGRGRGIPGPRASDRGAFAIDPRGRDVMRTDAPVVAVGASCPEVVDAVCSTRLNRAIVVDEAKLVVEC